MQAEVTGTEGDNILPAGINIDIIDKLIRIYSLRVVIMLR